MRVLALASGRIGGGVAATVDDPRAGERALIARAQSGDLSAFEALYRLNVERVYALCWRLADDDASAEELLQEVFVRAWSGLGSFRGDASFASWIRPVAVHLALDERRARSRRPRTVDADPAPVAATPAGSETGLDLDRALRRLPARCRAVFVLHDIEGHRHEEIAAMLRIDAGTSKSQLHRARKLLREALR